MSKMSNVCHSRCLILDYYSDSKNVKSSYNTRRCQMGNSKNAVFTQNYLIRQRCQIYQSIWDTQYVLPKMDSYKYLFNDVTEVRNNPAWPYFRPSCIRFLFLILDTFQNSWNRQKVRWYPLDASRVEYSNANFP